MFPILYEGINVGVVPQNNGLGVLSDAISCNCEEERNGIFEVTIQYPFSGIHAEQISRLRVIKVKPNFTDNPQLFYIDRLSKVMNGVFTIYCKHISYLLSGLPITSGTANSAAAACLLLQNSASGYNITTDKTASGNFKITEPSSVRSWFGGKAGSMLDVFGTGEWHYDNFNCNLKLHRGSDRGVTIRYKKNLLELSQEIDTSNLYTHVLCYWKNEDEMVLGSKLPTGLTLDIEKTLILDVSGDYEEKPTNQQLTTKAQNYIDNNNLTVPTNNIKLDFVQSGELANRVDLCDTVSIYYEALGITRTQVKCIRTVFDCIREKYIETEFGDPKTNIADTIIATNNEIATKPTVSYLDSAVQKATQLITGNLGGHLIIHDSNGDGEPDELLIMDTDDINTALNVWRFNQSGWGHSSTGYDGSYTLAATLDGGMVANFITTGFMSADRIRTGVILSNNNQLQIDLDNGTIIAPEITLQGQDVASTIDSLVQTSVETRYALSNSGTVIPSAFPLTDPTTPTEQQPYLWSRTIYTYADGQTNTSYAVSVRGANGQNGADGAGLQILGNYDTMADLIADHPTGSAGQAYMVGTDLVVWNTKTNSWENVGRIQGPSGADGLWLAIENDDNGTSMNVTYTAHLLKGVSDVTETYDAVFVWQMVKESGVTEIASNTPTITVSRDTADYGGVIRCICIAVLADESLQDYSYITIQDYSGNDIQIIGSNVVKLIGEAAIYKPYAIESQFQVLQDEISSRVTQTEFNSLEDTVTTQGTLIQQNAEEILLKADTTTVDAGLNGKMSRDMSNRSSSIRINSGQIRFDSNSLVVNSSQFTLDAQGNASFGGNLSAATLNIGGSSVEVGTAINNAQNNAIATAASDATNKANAAVSTAASDATTKANNAKSQAVSIAASDATSKANTAQSNAESFASAKASTAQSNAIAQSKSYTDTGLAGKVGNNEIRTKFAADTHSVTIQSGVVAFKSNTISIDSDNLKVTQSGRVSAKSFKAIDLFRVVNDSDVVLSSIEADSEGGIIAVGMPDTTQVAAMWASNGGNIGVANASGAPTVTITGSSGSITANGSIVCGGLTAQTQIVARNTSQSTKVFFNAGTYGYGALRNANGDNNIYFYGNTGNIEIAGQIINTSSRKVKENIKPIEDAEKILSLQAVSFDFKNKELGTDKRGFIAEEVAEVLPNLVHEETEERPAGLDYIGMIPYLQEMIKRQQSEIDILKSEIEKLKGEK